MSNKSYEITEDLTKVPVVISNNAVIINCINRNNIYQKAVNFIYKLNEEELKKLFKTTSIPSIITNTPEQELVDAMIKCIIDKYDFD